MNTNENPLISAINNGQTSIVLKLLEMGENVNIADENGVTALMMAVRNKDIFQAIIETNPDIGAVNNNGETILHVIAANGSVDELAMLPEQSVNFNSKDKYGNTPLHIAASFGEVEIVETLIKLGAHVDEVNERGETPLHLAIDSNIWSHEVTYHVQTIKTLIQYGADIQAKTNKGKTPLQLAQQYYDKSPHSEIKQVLLDFGAK